MINPIKFCFPEAVFIPCYFHFIQNCLKHLPDIKSSNEEKKIQVQDLLTNIKILCFINLSQFNAFFKKKLKLNIIHYMVIL